MARTKTSRTRGPGGRSDGKRWWQWFLLYPTFAGAILTAVPGIWDRALAVYHETRTSTYSEAVKQTGMWQRNIACAAGEFNAHNILNNMAVDATVCRSGDVFVRVTMAQNQVVYHWIALDDVLRTGPAQPGLIPAAHAAPAGWSLIEQIGAGAGDRPVAPRAQGYQPGTRIICQRFLDSRMIVRRVQTPQGCYDEVVDTMSGAVIRRSPAPCNPSC